MKYKLDLDLQKPLNDVWKAFNDVENLKKWQPSLVKVETISGVAGQVGAVSELTFSEGKREFTLTEKIIQREDPTRIEMLYENKFADNTVTHTFVEQEDGTTLWINETEYSFKTIVMKLMGPIMKGNFILRSRMEMNQFKELVERSGSLI